MNITKNHWVTLKCSVSHIFHYNGILDVTKCEKTIVGESSHMFYFNIPMYFTIRLLRTAVDFKTVNTVQFH